MTATRISILGALAVLLALPGCDDKKADAKADAKTEAKADKKEDGKADKKDEAKADKKEDAKAEPEKAGEPAGDAGAEAAGGDVKIGVAVCDEYISKYGKCIDEHAPENVRQTLKDSLAKTAGRYKAQSEGPEKDSLEQSCTAALDAVKKTSKNWGCTYE